MAQWAGKIIRRWTGCSIGRRIDVRKNGRQEGRVRIIGGEWRGRRLRIPSGAAVRPTPDRVRETVFNWLGPGIAGARCLDLYAGTGILGFEALSQGAAEVVMIERDARLFAALEAARTMLGAVAARLIRGDAVVLLSRAGGGPGDERAADGLSAGAFDVVFVDPPYREPIEPLLGAVAGLLSPGGLVYVERPAAAGLPALDGYRWHRRSQAGAVAFGLAAAR
jgi:16S rRNA (guanine966-N2)-methyltransferase